MHTKRALLLALAATLGACSESTNTPKGGELSAFGGDLPRFAVISGDDAYTSSSVGFLDHSARPVVESWLHSGTISPKLVEAIGGDAAFVTEERGDGTFTLIDRFGLDVISRFDLATGEVLGQTRMREAFAVNPYDVVYTDAGRAFVVRFGANPDAGASDLEAGNDLIEIDPDTAEILGLDEETGAIEGRVDLAPFSEDVVLGDAAVRTYASPASALEVNGALIVGLGRYSLDFAAIARGGVAVYDLDEGALDLVEMPDLRVCENVMRVPGRPALVAVHCMGAYGATEPERAVLVFEVGAGGSLEEVASFRESDHEGGALPLGHVVVLDDEHFFGLRFGEWDSEEDVDVGYLVSFEDGTATEVVRASRGGATLGRAAFDPDTGILLVPDAHDGVIHLEYEGGALEHVDTFSFGRAGLRVRGIVRL